MSGKPVRQHAIERLLSEHSVTSQTQLVDLLAAMGIEAAQATVSRDLDDLGAVKMRAGGQTVYAIPEIPAQRSVPLDALRRVFGDWLVNVAWSGPIVVLRTPPGSAHVVASAVDRSELDGVIGTVAGDDTVLVVAGADLGGEALAERFRELSGR